MLLTMTLFGSQFAGSSKIGFEITYNPLKRKISVICIFRFKASCNLDIMWIGSDKIDISIMILESSYPKMSPPNGMHFDMGMSLRSHTAATGLHWNASMKIVMINHKMHTTPITSIVRRAFCTEKIVRYQNRIDSFTEVMIGPKMISKA